MGANARVAALGSQRLLGNLVISDLVIGQGAPGVLLEALLRDVLGLVLVELGGHLRLFGLHRVFAGLDSGVLSLHLRPERLLLTCQYGILLGDGVLGRLCRCGSFRGGLGGGSIRSDFRCRGFSSVLLSIGILSLYRAKLFKGDIVLIQPSVFTGIVGACVVKRSDGGSFMVRSGGGRERAFRYDVHDLSAFRGRGLVVTT